MDRSNLIKIGSKYLTSDGTNTGLRCLTEIDGLHLLLFDNIGPIRKSVSGKPRKFHLENLGHGIDLIIRTPRMDTDRRDEIVGELDVASGTVNMTISGPSGTFDLDILPGDPSLTHSGKTRTDRIYDVVINVTVDSIN